MLKAIIGLWMMLIPLTIWAATPSQIIDKLQEAEDYLTVDPATTLSLLAQIDEVEGLPTSLFLRWHLIRLRAAVPTHQMKMMEYSLEAIFTHHTHPYFIEKLPTAMSALGIWLRRHDYLNDARLSLECAYKHAQSDQQRLILTNSLALVSRQLGDYEKAQRLYGRANSIADKAGITSKNGIIANNLGIIALELGNVAEAERQFRKALASYQEIDKRSGQISAGVNLLFAFIIQEQLLNYQRLYGPTSRLTESFPNETKQAMLLWVNARFMQLEGYSVSQQTKASLKLAYAQLQDDNIRRLVFQHLAKPLGVDVLLPKPVIVRQFERSWYKAAKTCDWPKAS
ncbi:tetratricopeptide repeat protein [Pseudoalteromonas rubra]|uniref:Tetratricopeptide repeat-containing protein n=1 Tax=Pseudoalteromonas rubra TaxID=43658 RepID=A0A5S3WZK9_9GAMM|nr:tetratricopeptide repeat protein [Pseudoalteromonas rubra]TMP37336.1 tetratricopeptide repeat-containing protein [Pseudoalteromonas rubra]